MKWGRWSLLIGGVVLMISVGVAGYYGGLFGVITNPNTPAAIALSVVVLLGLALVVVLMASLVIVYSVLELANKDQALGLPEGSVRALIAFSLVLVFVLLGAFLYRSVNDLGACATRTKITQAEVDELKKEFVVFAEPAKKADGVTPETAPDGKTPLYNVKYYTKHNKDADDFAKQIFTTLATVFVSVISFYFGSSAATSGAGAVAKALGGDGGKKNPPSITKLDPNPIPAGSTTLKITGNGLATVTKVKFDSDQVAVKPPDVTDTQVTVTVPANLLTQQGKIVKVSVVGDNGESSPMDFTIG
ncbi:MAG TPA: IPT/TIG domain-containing protein [Candidatus Angelobacter sp.]